MSVVAEDFLNSAEKLLNNPESSEINFRNSISRSYYAVYHVSKNIAEKLPIPQGIDEMGSHEKVIAAFEQHPKLSLRKFCYVIKQLKRKRCDADYELELDIEFLETEAHVNVAKRLLEELEQLKQAMIAK